MLMVFLCCCTPCAAAASAAGPDRYTVDFAHVTGTSVTQLTFQIVNNPLLDPEICPAMADNAWELVQQLTDLGAKAIRYAAWFPYPRAAVAELFPPNHNTRQTSWNFSVMARQLVPYLQIAKEPVISMSTQPAWVYANYTPSPQAPWPNPAAVDWQYSNGGRIVADTPRLLAAYFNRLAQWIFKGSFLDEFGRKIGGGPALVSVIILSSLGFLVRKKKKKKPC